MSDETTTQTEAESRPTGLYEERSPREMKLEEENTQLRERVEILNGLQIEVEGEGQIQAEAFRMLETARATAAVLEARSQKAIETLNLALVRETDGAEPWSTMEQVVSILDGTDEEASQEGGERV